MHKNGIKNQFLWVVEVEHGLLLPELIGWDAYYDGKLTKLRTSTNAASPDGYTCAFNGRSSSNNSSSKNWSRLAVYEYCNNSNSKWNDYM